VAEGSVPVKTLAELFDCDEKTIRNLVDRGIVIRTARGRYLLSPSVTNYVRHLRAQAAGRMGSDDAIDAIKEGALLKREQRRNYELKNAVLEAAAIPVEAIEPAWSRVVRAVRAGILAAPSKIRFELPHLTAFDAEKIEGVLRMVLEDAACGDASPNPEN